MPKRKRRTRAQEHRALVRAHRQYYDALLEFQGGGCAICGKPPGPRRHHMDHDHKSMELRGILCPYHNRLLTHRLTPDVLHAMLRYLLDTPWARFRRAS